MVENPDWQRLKKHAFESFRANGYLGARELKEIINCGCDNCHFDDREKADLIKIISSTTRADLSDDMWAKVADLIHKFELEDDKDAVIADMPDEDDLLDTSGW